ncbi:GPGG-motif small membrane protein [Actinoplanes sp. NPDC020271]
MAAVVLLFTGSTALVRRRIRWGVVLIVVGLLIGPAGVSIFS